MLAVPSAREEQQRQMHIWNDENIVKGENDMSEKKIHQKKEKNNNYNNEKRGSGKNEQR
jgi:hypothetical protein